MALMFLRRSFVGQISFGFYGLVARSCILLGCLCISLLDETYDEHSRSYGEAVIVEQS